MKSVYLLIFCTFLFLTICSVKITSGNKGKEESRKEGRVRYTKTRNEDGDTEDEEVDIEGLHNVGKQKKNHKKKGPTVKYSRGKSGEDGFDTVELEDLKEKKGKAGSNTKGQPPRSKSPSKSRSRFDSGPQGCESNSEPHDCPVKHICISCEEMLVKTNNTNHGCETLFADCSLEFLNEECPLEGHICINERAWLKYPSKIKKRTTRSPRG